MPAHKTHGYRQKPLYGVWKSMKSRCLYPSQYAYQYYGAKGIRVCERWMSFANFLEDMGERPEGMTLDRIDRTGNYEPTNCRWATWEEQANNKSAPGTALSEPPKLYSYHTSSAPRAPIGANKFTHPRNFY